MSTLHNFAWELRHHHILGSFTYASTTACCPGLKHCVLLYPNIGTALVRPYEEVFKMMAILSFNEPVTSEIFI